MEPDEIVGILGSRPGVSSVLIADQGGAILGHAGDTDPEALAAAAVFVVSCVTRLGDSLALGDPLYVLAASAHRRLAFVQGTAGLAAMELSGPAVASGACHEALALLHGR
ncbi:MAG: hypothetical protein MUE60_00150 [Candidatus Eisenbacteria bacterium]|nr:hypothetical protein [Candidatus Eisenbacteria bacterium]